MQSDVSFLSSRFVVLFSCLWIFSLESLSKPSEHSYTEVITILYANNTFDLNGLETALLLSYTLLPQRLNSITSLRLTWAFFQSFLRPAAIRNLKRKALFPGDEATWKACWKVIAGMGSLRDIRVWLAMSPALEMPKRVEREMLAPLADVGRKRVFKVRVSWTLKEWEDEPDEMESGKTDDETVYEIIRQEDQDWGAGALRLQNR